MEAELYSPDLPTVCVAGSSSRVGKTEFASRLLSRLPGWSACKVTTCVERAGQACPRGNGEGCGVCASLDEDYTIVEETGAEKTRGKDTGRLLAAGAIRVLWIRCRPHAVLAAIRVALEKLGRAPGVVFEGNHVLQVVRPLVSVMILSPDGRMKRSARDIRDRVRFFAQGLDDAETLRDVLAAAGLPR